MSGQITVQQALQKALELTNTGKLLAAKQIVQQILMQMPQYAPALNLQGTIAYREGRKDLAEVAYGKAVEAASDRPQYRFNLGLTLSDRNKHQEAEAQLRKATELNPEYYSAWNTLGHCLIKQKRYDEAETALKRALELKPDYAFAFLNLGLAYTQQHRMEEAEDAFRKSIGIEPNQPRAYSNLSVILMHTGRLDEAEEVLKKAIELAPNEAQAYGNLSAVLLRKHQLDEAEKVLHDGIKAAPESSVPYSNLGYILMNKKTLAAADKAFLKAISLSPTAAMAHFNRAQLLLMQRQFKEGWDEYEYRIGIGQKKHFHEVPPHRVRWTGEELKGKTLYVYSDQGAGDNIQFSRYLQPLAEQGARVLYVPNKSLIDLLRLQDSPVEILTEAKEAEAENYDFHTPLSSIPRWIGADDSNVPYTDSYLKADPEAVKAAKERYFDNDDFKVAIAWQGNPSHVRDWERSVKLERFLPLQDVPGVKLYSFQKGTGEEALEDVDLPGLGADFDSFADTAAALANVDLVISIDSALAHLGGAMGIPTWVLVTCLPDWRWFLDEDVSSWYESVRIFRQPTAGDWDAVFEEVTEQLKLFKQA